MTMTMILNGFIAGLVAIISWELIRRWMGWR